MGSPTFLSFSKACVVNRPSGAATASIPHCWHTRLIQCVYSRLSRDGSHSRSSYAAVQAPTMHDPTPLRISSIQRYCTVAWRSIIVTT